LPARWQAELGPVDADTVLLMARLALLSRRVGEAYQEDLRSFGLTYTEYAILHSLRIEGPPHRLSPSALNRVLALSSGGITKTVDRLESAGLVVRGPDPRDGRGVQVELTPRGRERAAQIFDNGVQKYSETFARFDRAELRRAVDALGAILEAFDGADASRHSQRRASD
jgi:DNA-binding MarR family transcriptional regulator